MIKMIYISWLRFNNHWYSTIYYNALIERKFLSILILHYGLWLCGFVIRGFMLMFTANIFIRHDMTSKHVKN